MSENTTQAPATPVANLRETRKQMAEAKKRHPSTAAKPKAPAKKAEPTRTTLRWVFPEGKDRYKDGKVQVAAFGDGELAILRSGEKWTAVFRKAGKVVETLAEPGSFGRAYSAATRYAKGQAA